MRGVDVSQWVVAFFPKTKEKNFYGIRLFKTVDHAAAHYGKSARTKLLFTSAGEMAHRLAVPRLQQYLKEVVAQFADDGEQYKSSTLRQDPKLWLSPNSVDELVAQGSREALASGLWQLCHLLGDQVHGLPDSPENEDKFKIRLDRLASPEGREVWEKFPKQARVICQALIDLNEPVVEELELHTLIKDLKGRGVLITKQDPVLIWRYYAPIIGDNGFLFYPGKRNKLESHAEEMSSI